MKHHLYVTPQWERDLAESRLRYSIAFLVGIVGSGIGFMLGVILASH